MHYLSAYTFMNKFLQCREKVLQMDYLSFFKNNCELYLRMCIICCTFA